MEHVFYSGVNKVYVTERVLKNKAIGESNVANDVWMTDWEIQRKRWKIFPKEVTPLSWFYKHFINLFHLSFCYVDVLKVDYRITPKTECNQTKKVLLLPVTSVGNSHSLR
jgi:hypothetical protein